LSRAGVRSPELEFGRGRFLNDLLPLPYTEETLAHFSARVRKRRTISAASLLIRKPSSYLQ